MRLNLRHHVHHYYDNYKKGRASKVKRHPPLDDQKFRNQADNGKVDGPAKGETRYHPIDVTRGLKTWSDTRNKRA